MSSGSNYIWPVLLLLGVSVLLAANAVSPLDVDCPPGALPGTQGCGDGTTIVDELEVLDGRRWVSESHHIGAQWLDSAHVTHVPGSLRLGLPGGVREGAEIRSRRRGLFRSAHARFRIPDAPGALVGFFLYEGVRGANDEIDIELFPGGRRIMLSTWVDGEMTNHVETDLPFDPSGGFHDYRIEWTRDRVGFYVDGALLEEFETGLPTRPMFLMANAWWPHWLDGSPPVETLSLDIDHLAF